MPRPLFLIALAVWASLLLSDASASARFAVLVGVGAYDPASAIPGMGNVSGGNGINLKSPPNDVALMGEILSRYGFDADNTISLKDADATRERILAAVQTNLLSLPSDSLAVFFFSGHGSALQGKDGVGEWIDETIVPYDGRLSGKPPRDIVDDEIYAWIETLNGNGVTAVFIFDSCFSGGISRFGNAESKSLPAVTGQDRENRDGQRTLRTGALPGRPSPVIVLTASEADEPAQGVLVKDQFQGIFTTALRNVLLADDNIAIPPARWGDALDRVTSSLKISRSDMPVQSPRIFGNRDAKIFDNAAPFSNAVAAKRVSDNRATIFAGSDLGVTVGSVYKLFGPSEIPWRKSDRFETKGRVIAVRPADADVEAVDDTRFQSESLAAVEFEYAVPERRIKIRIPDDGKIDPFDRKAILNGLERLAEIGDRDAELVVVLADERWRLTTTDLVQVGSPIPAGDTALLRDELVLRVTDYLRWNRLSDWKRSGAVPTQIRYRLLSQTIDKPSSPIDIVDGKVTAGAILQVVVENRSGRTIRADAVLLRPNFVIDVCPIGRLEPKQELATELVELDQFGGNAAWKIVLSDPAQQMSLLFLNSGNGARSIAASLDDELSRVWNGVRAGDRGPAPGDSFWQTVDLPFRVTDAHGPPTASPVKRCLGLPQK